MRRLFGYLLVIGLPVVGAAYMAEIYLRYLGAKVVAGVIAQKSGHTYDPRSKLEFVADLRKAGKKRRFIVARNLVSRARQKSGISLKGKDGIGLLSPGGVSKRVNVVCNESGSFSIMSLTGIALTIPTRYGILVETISSYSVALLRLGNCVPRGKSTIEVLRSRTGQFDQTRWRRQWAALYVCWPAGIRRLIKPKTVLWFCYNNDIEYLRKERCNSILRTLFGQTLNSCTR